VESIITKTMEVLQTGKLKDLFLLGIFRNLKKLRGVWWGSLLFLVAY